MSTRTCPYAVLAEFAEPEPLVAAAKAMREQGWQVETYTPFPVDGLVEALGFDEIAVGVATLLGGIVGTVFGFAVQAGANLLYPLDIGGRAPVAVPAFVLVSIEVGIVLAAFAGIGTMLAKSRLPRLHHPLFDAARFGLASDDRFFLALLARDGDFDAHAARAALWRLRPVEVTDVGELKVS